MFNQKKFLLQNKLNNPDIIKVIEAVIYSSSETPQSIQESHIATPVVRIYKIIL